MASTKRSCLAVDLPLSFTGPISWHSRRGTVNFSPAIKERLTQFGQREDTGFEHGFIGDWAGSGYRGVKVDEVEWAGDEVILETESGSLWVYFVDEHHKGVAETMLGWFGIS